MPKSHKITQKSFDQYRVRFLEKNKTKDKGDGSLFIKGEKLTFNGDEVREILKDGGDLQIWHATKKNGQYTVVLKTVGGAVPLQSPWCC